MQPARVIRSAYYFQDRGGLSFLPPAQAEKYDTIFAEFFIAALDGHTGDRDKNRRVSIWEAFRFASQKVEKWYADQNRIPVEHAVLDDNGDGIFSDDPKPPENDGMLAQIAYLDLIPAKPTDDKKRRSG